MNALTVRPVLAVALLGLIAVPAAAQQSVVSWGLDGFGAVSGTPTASGFTQVAGGGYHSLALRTNGSIVSWGRDSFGQVSNTPSGTGFVQVAGGLEHSLALRTDGSIVSWGQDLQTQVSHTPSGSGFTQIAGGGRHSLALHPDGSIVSWGWDIYGQVSNTPSGSGFTQIAGGGRHSLALHPDGSIEAWGWDIFGQVSGTPSGTGFTQVAGDETHSLALRADGSIAAWGYDGWGQVSNTPSGTGFVQVAAGREQSVALRADGSIVSWGRDLAGVVSNTPGGTGFTQVAAGSWYHSLALRNDNSGIPYCFGDGAGAACPCDNSGTLGEGCMNSTGAGGASLLGVGHASFASDSFRLVVEGAPGITSGLLLRGTTQVNGGLGRAIGDGLLCVGGSTLRSQVQITSAGATTFSNFRGQPFGQSSNGAGVPTNYQFWYRDTANPCSGAGFNFSNAWATTWSP